MTSIAKEQADCRHPEGLEVVDDDGLRCGICKKLLLRVKPGRNPVLGDEP